METKAKEKHEMSPWVLIVNTLYYTRGLGKELSLNHEENPYFWVYALKVLEEFKKEAPEVTLFCDRYSLERTIQNDTLYFSVRDNKLVLDPKFNKMTLKNINKYFPKEIKDKFPEIFAKAYAETESD